jgi:hypothetical protein
MGSADKCDEDRPWEYSLRLFTILFDDNQRRLPTAIAATLFNRFPNVQRLAILTFHGKRK